MVGPILKEAVVLVVFCHIFVSGKDLLETFQPNPSLPHELNEWLASVQKHKNDFRLIREVLAKKFKNEKLTFEDEDNGAFNKKKFRLHSEDGINDHRAEHRDTRPRNDIYPYMYKSGNFETNNKKVNLKKGSLRLRRASDNTRFFEHKNLINLEPKSKVGEIKRSDEKYPERYKEPLSEMHDSNKMKSNFKEDVSEAKRGISKRNVEIDIKKDGKLVKKIRENVNSPKSIILNIDHLEEKVPPLVAVQSPLSSPNQILETNSYNLKKENHNAEIIANTKPPPQRSINFNTDQTKSKESYSNFKNLFTANEHLNTDSSSARQSASVVGPLVYHVTIPNFATYDRISSSFTPQPEFSPPQLYEESKTVPSALYPNFNLNTDTKSNLNLYDFNHNNFQDMSKFWTDSEKHQMQKGIAFARNNANLKKLIQHIKYPQKVQSQNENETGFEPAQRIEVDNGKLVKINVAEKVHEKNDLTSDVYTSIKRNNIPERNSNREGIIEVDGQKPSLCNDAKTSTKRNINNKVNKNKDDRIVKINGVQPDFLSNIHKTKNAEDKNTIPNIMDISKPENKRQLEYLQGRIQLMNNKNSDENLSNPLLLTEADNKQKVESDAHIPNIDTNAQNVQEKLEQPVPQTNVDSVSTDPLRDAIARMLANPEPTTTVANDDNNAQNGQEKVEPLAQQTNVLELQDPLKSPIPKVPVNPIFNVEPVKIETQGVETGQEFTKKNEDQVNPKAYEIPNAEMDLFNKGVKQNVEPIGGNFGTVDESEDTSKSHQPYSNLGNDVYDTHSRPETEPELESPQLGNGAVLQGRPLQLNTVQDLRRIDNLEIFNRKLRDDIRSQAVGYRKMRRNPYRQRSRIYSEKFDPNLNKIVIVYNSPRYASVRRKIPRYVNYPNDMSGDINNGNEESLERSDWDRDVDLVNYRNQIASHFSPNLIIRKRDNIDNQVLPRKRHRKRHHHEDDYLGNILYNSEPLKRKISKARIDDENEFKFTGRGLKTIEYVYDTYDKSGDDYYDDVSTELQESASESEGRVELLQKDSVEGDYGDEEDSVTEKQKKAEFNIVKKTNNEFANPRTTTEGEDEYFNNDYDNSSYVDKPIEKPQEQESLVVEDSYMEKAKHIGGDKTPPVLSDSDISSVHHGHTAGNKFKSKLTHKHGHLIPVKANKVRFDSNGDALVRKNARKISRNRRNRVKHPNKVFLDKMSDFQHWPTFVVDDHENEEKLKKRSLTVNKRPPHAYNFPMASRDFFVKTKKKRRIDSGTMESERAVPVYGGNAPLMIEKRNTEPDPLPTSPAMSAPSMPAPSMSEMPVASTRVNDVATPATNGSCTTCGVSINNACEMDENFKNSEEVSTILTIDSPQGNENNTNHGIYEKLDDVLDGYFPSKLVCNIFDEIKKNARLQQRFTKGLKRTNKNLMFQNLNDTNSEETRKILDSMSCLMSRLQLSATCQTLPSNLRTYLTAITKIKKEDALAHMKEMEEINFEGSQNQKNFIFESAPQTGGIQDKAQMLKDLLDKFNKLPEKCKERAEPVKEYIEKHLAMLDTVMETPDQSSEQKSIQSRSNTFPQPDDSLVQEQLESLGLGMDNADQELIPKFDLDKILESDRHEKAVTAIPGVDLRSKVHLHNGNVNKRDLKSVTRSKKYNKLLDAVRKVKLKRDAKRRIAEAFGRSGDYSGLNFNLKNIDAKDIAKASFESPLVFSL